MEHFSFEFIKSFKMFFERVVVLAIAISIIAKSEYLKFYKELYFDKNILFRAKSRYY